MASWLSTSTQRGPEIHKCSQNRPSRLPRQHQGENWCAYHWVDVFGCQGRDCRGWKLCFFPQALRLPEETLPEPLHRLPEPQKDQTDSKRRAEQWQGKIEKKKHPSLFFSSSCHYLQWVLFASCLIMADRTEVDHVTVSLDLDHTFIYQINSPYFQRRVVQWYYILKEKKNTNVMIHTYTIYKTLIHCQLFVFCHFGVRVQPGSNLGLDDKTFTAPKRVSFWIVYRREAYRKCTVIQTPRQHQSPIIYANTVQET